MGWIVGRQFEAMYKGFVKAGKDQGLTKEEIDRKFKYITSKMEGILSDKEYFNREIPLRDSEFYKEFDEVVREQEYLTDSANNIIFMARSCYNKTTDIDQWIRFCSCMYGVLLCERYDYEKTLMKSNEDDELLMNNSQADFIINEMIDFMYHKIKKDYANQTAKDFSNMKKKRRKKRKR